MGWKGRLFMLGLHVAGFAWCAFLYWVAAGWPIFGGWWLLGPWLIIGFTTLVLYILTWTDTPAPWWWPYLIMCWPIMWGGGIVHPLR